MQVQMQKSGKGLENGNHPFQMNGSCEKLQPWIIAYGSDGKNEIISFYGSEVEEVNAFQ